MVSDGSWWNCDAAVPTPEGSTSGFGDGSLGTAQFSTTGISQTGGSVDIDSVLSTGTKAGGPGASSYGGGLPSSNVYEFTVPNKDGQYDGDMTVVQLEGLTIDENVWLTTDQPGRGLLIYVEGDAVINGTLSMTARGAYTPNINNEVNPEGLQYPVAIAGEGLINTSGDFTGAGTEAENIASGISVNGEGKVFTIKREGAGGALGTSVRPSDACDPELGNPGYNGATGESGGGGSGGSGCVSYTGNGVAGTAFSGGGGTGGTRASGASASAVPYGGAGSAGIERSGGGAGNPGGDGHEYGGVSIGGDGTGGLLILVVGGNINIGINGKVTADGMKGGDVGIWGGGGGAGGGGSGGGNILVLYGDSISGESGIVADGGNGGNGDSIADGGDGGDGSVQISKIDSSSSSPILLVNGDHTGLEAQALPNFVSIEDIGSGDQIARLSGGSCPVGWAHEPNWSTTQAKTDGGYTYGFEKDSGDGCGASYDQCTTGSHTWGNIATESCSYGYSTPGRGCGSGPLVIYATITEIGCY